jgi:hypothetical protein
LRVPTLTLGAEDFLLVASTLVCHCRSQPFTHEMMLIVITTHCLRSLCSATRLCPRRLKGEKEYLVSHTAILSETVFRQ